MARLAKRDFERKIAKNIKKTLKTFFKYACSKTKLKSTVGPLLDDNDELTCHDRNMGQMLNAFFASVFTTECVEELPDCNNIFQGNGENKLRNYHVSPSMVKSYRIGTVNAGSCLYAHTYVPVVNTESYRRPPKGFLLVINTNLPY